MKGFGINLLIGLSLFAAVAVIALFFGSAIALFSLMPVWISIPIVGLAFAYALGAFVRGKFT